MEVHVSSDTKRPKNPSADAPATRPKNPSANILPTEGYVLEIDGKFKTEYVTAAEALKAGFELKKKCPQIQVKVYDAKERTRTPVEYSEQLEKKTEAAS
jgi:hypothetical protein